VTYDEYYGTDGGGDTLTEVTCDKYEVTDGGGVM
jgi:hypothetical protein